MLDHEILHHKHHAVDTSEISFLESGQHQNRRMSQRKLDLDVKIASNLHQLATTIRALEEHGMALEDSVNLA